MNQPGPYVMYTTVDSNGYLKNASGEHFAFFLSLFLIAALTPCSKPLSSVMEIWQVTFMFLKMILPELFYITSRLISIKIVQDKCSMQEKLQCAVTVQNIN